VKPFRDIRADQLDTLDLKQELTQHGYILIRQLLPPKGLQPILSDIAHILHQSGWLEPGYNPLRRIANRTSACAEDDPQFKPVYDRVFAQPSFHALPHHAALQSVMKSLVGPELLILPKSAPRLIFPNHEPAIIRAHQDYNSAPAHLGTFTAWIPLHDCPVDQGPLRVLEGSAHFGVQPGTLKTGFIEPGTERGDEWATGAIHAGDVLLFNSLMIHEALPNTSRHLRLSVDCRFQSYLNPVDPAVLVFTGPGSRSWEATYANWPPDDLKFYWTKLPLQLKPSVPELIRLAESSESPKMRARYARILDRISIQLPAAAQHRLTPS